MAEFLADAGFRTVEAAKADHALLLFRVTPSVRLIVTGIKMPGHLDGICFARAALEHRVTIPIIFISGQPDKRDEARGIGEPVAFLQKPFKFEYFLLDVRRLAEVGHLKEV